MGQDAFAEGAWLLQGGGFGVVWDASPLAEGHSGRRIRAWQALLRPASALTA